MNATFKPTKYVFHFEDRYFIEVIYQDGTQKCIASTEECTHAKVLADSELKRESVKAVYIFTRTQQILSMYRREAVAA